MADKFSLDDILEEYAGKAKNTREKSDFDVEELLENPLGHRHSFEDIADEAVSAAAADKTSGEAFDPSLQEEKTPEALSEQDSAPADITSAVGEASSDEEVLPETKEEVSAHVSVDAVSDVKAESEKAKQTGIENIDVDSLVESAVDGVETTDEPIALQKSDMNIKLDSQRVRAEDSVPDLETDFGAIIASEMAHKKQSKRDIEREEEERLGRAGSEAAQNSRFRLRKTSGNTAIIEGLMKLKRERKPVSKEVTVTPVKRLKIKDVDLNLRGKIIPKTEQFDAIKEDEIDFPDNATDTMKMNILSERRRNKIKNFVLHTDDRDDEETEKEVENTIGDFTDYKNASKVLSDIVSLKNNLTVRLCVLIVTALFTVYISLANDLGWPIIEAFKRTNDTTYIITNVVLGLVSAFVSYTVISAGFKKLLKRQADCDSIAAISITAAVVVSIITLFDPSMLQTKSYNLYMSVAVLTLLFNTLGKLLIVNRTLRNFRYVAGEFDKYALCSVMNEDVAVKFTKGAVNDFPELATMRKTEFNENFLKNSYSTDAADRFCKTYAPLILIVSLVVGLLALVCDRNAVGFGERVIAGFVTFSGTVAMVSSFALMFVVNLPLDRASKKYLQSSAVMLGYSAVEDFADTNSILVDARQLFPEGMINLVNLKAMSSAPIEESILMAASLACQANSVLQPTFYNMLKGKTEMLYPVESYIFEDGLGLSGWIENKRVLLGTRELMENHSIEGLPTKAREHEYTRGYIPVYLSVGGVVTALFVIRANAGISVKKWLATLEKDEVTTVIRTVDGFISLGFLSDLFDIEPDSIKLLPFRFHEEYEHETDFTERARSSMLCSGHFPSFAMLIDGVKRLQFIANLGVTIQMAAALLGGLIALVMTIFGTFSGLSASVVILYNLIWFAVTVLSQFIKRL